MKIRASGYGAGTRQTPGNANVLRISLGEASAGEGVSPEEQVAVIDATIDDMSPQIYGYFQEKALAAGALDVYATPIQMKKNRPALKVTCVCAIPDLDRLAELIFRETTTIGIRYTIAHRKTLRREFSQVQTVFGAVTMKVSLLDGQPVNFVPEFEDCRRLATEKGVALKEVQAAAIHAYLQSKKLVCCWILRISKEDKKCRKKLISQISIEDFAKVQMRVGQILEAEKIEGSRKLIKLRVDIGTRCGRLWRE